MKQSLVMFESGRMHLYHNRVDVSESRKSFLRKAIADLEAHLAQIEGADDA